MEVTNSLGDTTSLTLDVVVRDSDPDAPQIKLTKYLVYLNQGADLDPLEYLAGVTGGESYNVTASLPEGGFTKGVNEVTYSCMGSTGLTGSTTLYVIVE